MQSDPPDQLTIYVHVPDDAGLTDDQIAYLKQSVTVEFVSTTLNAKSPTHVVIQLVDGHRLPPGSD